MRARVLVWWVGLAACGPELPLGDKDTGGPVETDEPPDTSVPDETDLPPTDPCAVREAEPNNTPAEATVLPTEVRGCGGFSSETDADYWSFELTEQTWIQLDVTAFEIGSLADVEVTLSAAGTGLFIRASQWIDRPDVRLLFPSDPTTFQLLVNQAAGARGEGDAHFYEVFASTSKPPEGVDATEQEPNDTAGEAQTIRPGDTVLGFVDDAGDEDVYALALPAGAHELVLDVDASVLGSASDVALEVRDAQGTVVASATNGAVGYDRDPSLSWSSTTRQDVTVVVRSQLPVTEVGPAQWYVLRTSLEAE